MFPVRLRCSRTPTPELCVLYEASGYSYRSIRIRALWEREVERLRKT